MEFRLVQASKDAAFSVLKPLCVPGIEPLSVQSKCGTISQPLEKRERNAETGTETKLFKT